MLMNRKTIIGVALALLCSGSAFAGGHNPYTSSRIFWSTNLHTIAPGTYPRIIQLSDGRLLAVFESGGINVAISSDGGNSWNRQMIQANPQGITEANPDVIQLRDGTIVVAYNQRPQRDGVNNFGIRCKRSTDGGNSWSSEIYISNAGQHGWDGCWEPNMVQLSNGTLQIYYADEGPFPNNDDQQITMRESPDGGASWYTQQDFHQIIYRQGHRDGMPSGAILKDGSLAIAFEDNGWTNAFVPTIAHSTDNWSSVVTGNSGNRWKAFADGYNEFITGGAPYLRVLKNGETLLSHQYVYRNENGNELTRMYTYVGDENARNFKAVAMPFRISDGQSAKWNSVSVLNDGSVLATGEVNGQVGYVTGRAANHITAPAARPKVDGVASNGDGYPFDGSQISLRLQNADLKADFAHDNSNLYFTASTTESNSQGVSLLIDPFNRSETDAVDEVFKISFDGNGNATAYRGNGSNGWNRISANITTSVNRNGGYNVEAAIPLSAIGFNGSSRPNYPSGTFTGRANVILNSTGEGLPDALEKESWSWMTFNFEGVYDDSQPTNPGANPDSPKSNTGDVDGNGSVNITDAVSVINSILGKSSLIASVADVNGDGVVNITDAVAIVNQILSK